MASIVRRRTWTEVPIDERGVVSPNKMRAASLIVSSSRGFPIKYFSAPLALIGFDETPFKAILTSSRPVPLFLNRIERVAIAKSTDPR